MNWIDEFPYDDANEKYVLSELGFDSVYPINCGYKPLMVYHCDKRTEY